MNSHIRNIGLAAALLFATLGSGYAQKEAHHHAKGFEARGERAFCERQLGGELFSRTELFFGTSKPDGTSVSDADFQSFVDFEVTPRFPDGLTLLSGVGQFRNAQGNIIKEGSKLLILLYPFSKTSSTAVDAIRSAYKTQFQQESVLRVDEQSCISF